MVQNQCVRLGIGGGGRVGRSLFHDDEETYRCREAVLEPGMLVDLLDVDAFEGVLHEYALQKVDAVVGHPWLGRDLVIDPDGPVQHLSSTIMY